MRYPTRNQGIVAGILIFLILVLIVFDHGWLSSFGLQTTELVEGVPFPALVGALIVLGIALVVAGWDLVLVVAASAFALMLYELFKYSEIDIGHRRDFLYVLAISLAVILFTRGSRFALAFTLLVFTILGLSQFWTYPQVRDWVASKGGTRYASTTSSCSRIWEVSFDRTPVQINPLGSCAPDLWTGTHCIYAQRSAWTNDRKVYGPLCTGGLPKDTEWVWSADSAFVGKVSLSPPRYN
jgi:hypothetical protein